MTNSPLSTELDDADDDNSHQPGWNVDDADDDSGHTSPTSASASTHEPNASSNNPPKSSEVHVAGQKRRRVTRACDECRRKKIKCDGRQPCTHCTVYSYECTYDQPSNRRRNPPPQYIEALEDRVQRAEALLRHYLPDFDLADPTVDALLKKEGIPVPALRKSGTVNAAQSLHFTRPDSPAKHDTKAAAAAAAAIVGDSELESMVNATGLLDIDDHGRWDYTGHSSGKSFLQSLRERFGVTSDALDVAEAPAGVASRKSHFIESPAGSFVDSPLPSNPLGAELPSREVAIELCEQGLIDAIFVLPCVHRPSFFRQLNQLYDTSPEMYTDDDHRFLPLLYVVIALGRLFASESEPDGKSGGYRSALDEAGRYFWAARQLMDVCECREITSLQAIIFMCLFLQCTAKLSTCYSYVGVAMRSSIRMGLHRTFKDCFTPVEAELRKRCFWVVRRMDIQIGAMLGLPLMLADNDIDQEYPIELDDEYITDTAYLPMPEGRLSFMAAVNANFRLSTIVSKITREIYPIKPLRSSAGTAARTHSVRYGKIREMEDELHEWMEALPAEFKPGDACDPSSTRVQRVLRMSYAYAQMLLYRPFVHYVSSQNPPKFVDQGAYVCSAAAISVSQNAIHITCELMRKNMLVGSYWMAMYTTFFAVLTLVYFVRENPSNASTKKVRRDASEGRAVLAKMATRSWAADRCTATLNALFAQLPDPSQPRTPTWPDEVPGHKRRSRDLTINAQAAQNYGNANHIKTLKQSKRANTHPSTLAETATASPRTGEFSPQHSIHSAHDPLEFPSHRYPQHANTMTYISPGDSPDSSVALQQAHNPHLDFTQLGAGRTSSVSSGSHLQGPEYYEPSGLPEVSAMMFPSTDPFAYPNQPLEAFERTAAFDKHGAVQGAVPNTSGFADPFQYMPPGTAGTGAADMGQVSSGPSGLPAHMYGPLAGFYGASGSASSGADALGGAVFTTGASTGAVPAPMANGQPAGFDMNDGMWDPAARSQGVPVNLDDIFGSGDWSGAMGVGSQVPGTMGTVFSMPDYAVQP